MTTKIIAITGYAGSGKSTVANMIHRILPDSEILSFADGVRTMAEGLTGVPAERWKTPEVKRRLFGDTRKNLKTGREILQLLGTEVGRDMFWQNAWVSNMETRVEASQCEYVIIDDLRFINEAEMVKNRGRIIRLIAPTDMQAEYLAHRSEIDIPKINWDAIIQNNKQSIIELRTVVEKVLIDEFGSKVNFKDYTTQIYLNTLEHTLESLKEAKIIVPVKDATGEGSFIQGSRVDRLFKTESVIDDYLRFTSNTRKSSYQFCKDSILEAAGNDAWYHPRVPGGKMHD